MSDLPIVLYMHNLVGSIMTQQIALLSRSADFERAWKHAFADSDFVLRKCSVEEISDCLKNTSAAIVDADMYTADADELLAIVGYMRASSKPVAVASFQNGIQIEDIIDDLCDGLVAHNESQALRVADRLKRRINSTRTDRFEFVIVSPDAKGVLTIKANGESSLLPRPIDDEDDLSAIVDIELRDDAKSARISLESGRSLTIQSMGPRANSRPILHDANSAEHFEMRAAQVGARLRELRLAAGLTQAELARRTGIHRPNIARVEAGRHTPSLETLNRIVLAIGVPASQLFSDFPSDSIFPS
ncbi:MAG: helix-turn-helix transcriptional regulator [Polyangiales bacterium]